MLGGFKKIEYGNGWVRTDNVFAYPYDWQQPAKTELWAYEKLLNGTEEKHSNKQYICFPWATLVDYLDYNPKKAERLLSALENAPPKMALNVVTYCQHIYALKLLPVLKKLGINEVFWSHKIKGQDEIDGIKLRPYPLYPVMHYKRKKPYKNKPLSERKYLYSFIGSYQPGLYLTPVRKWIFDLPEREDAYVKKREGWHFEQDVYDSCSGRSMPCEQRLLLQEKYENEYISVMEDTVYCLCPSGSGPNSIRLWEAVEFGCIPVVLSDSLDVAGLKKGKVLPVAEKALNAFIKKIILNKTRDVF